MNDAFRLLPYADILYACDAHWWRHHIADVQRMFHGERWTTHEGRTAQETNYKGDFPPEWNVNLVRGRDGKGFSADPSVLHYGGNSGFQAINLALLKGATRVILVGFDMRGSGHFFGDHPEGFSRPDDYGRFVSRFCTATVPILNATAGSGLKCYPMIDLEDALGAEIRRPDGGGDCDRAFVDARAG